MVAYIRAQATRAGWGRRRVPERLSAPRVAHEKASILRLLAADIAGGKHLRGEPDLIATGGPDADTVPITLGPMTGMSRCKEPKQA